MDSISTNNSTDTTVGFFSPTDEQLELLQSILQAKSNDAISLDEAREIGVQLVSLYECLSSSKPPTETQGYAR